MDASLGLCGHLEVASVVASWRQLSPSRHEKQADNCLPAISVYEYSFILILNITSLNRLNLNVLQRSPPLLTPTFRGE